MLRPCSGFYLGTKRYCHRKCECPREGVFEAVALTIRSVKFVIDYLYVSHEPCVLRLNWLHWVASPYTALLAIEVQMHQMSAWY